MRTLLLLGMCLITPPLLDAQAGRRALEAGREHYLLADYEGALPLLALGLDPGAGPVDSLWTKSVERLTDVLLVLRQDSLAAAWLRWAMRVAPSFSVDEEDMPPAVVRAARAAQEFVDSTPHDPFAATVRFEWPGTTPLARTGAVRLAGAAIPITARIAASGTSQFLRGGETRRIDPGSYDVVVSAPGYLPTRLSIEVLPGVTSVVTASLLPETAALLTVVTRPWATLYVNDRRIGYTPVALHRITPGRHALRVQRGQQVIVDTTITPLDRQRVLLSWGGPRETTGDALVDSALALLDAGETERGVRRLEDLLGSEPVVRAGPGVTALARVAEAIWALGDRDSSRACLRRLVHSDPFYQWPAEINPDVRSAYARERRRTRTIAMRTASDTVIVPDTGALPIEIGVGQAGEVRLSLRLTQSRPRDSVLLVMTVDSVAVVPLRLVLAEGGPLPPGEHALVAELGVRGGHAATLELTVERLAVDTLPHAPLRFAPLPETRPGRISRRTALEALALGTAGVAIPMLLNDGALSGRSLPPAAALIGASVSVATLLGRRERAPIPENVARNAAVRAEWAEREARIIEENRKRLNAAPLRIQARRLP